jgi:hypothetical protein
LYTFFALSNNLLASSLVVLAHAAFSFPIVPVNPNPPLKLSMVFPVKIFTMLPVVSWSDILNIAGIPLITSNVFIDGFCY